jgi:undecaprenyl-diphosphatase
VAVAAVLVAANVLLFLSIAEDVLDGGGLISHDEAVLAWFVEHRTDRLATAAKIVSTIGSFVSLLIIGVLIGIWLWRRCSDLLLAAAPVVSLTLSSLASTTAKSVFGRERPPVSVHATSVTLAAFPSGHATDAAGFFLAASLTLTLTVARRRSVQALFIGIGLLLAALVGVSRLVLGVHWLSDVVAGWALGSAIAITVVMMLWHAAAGRRRHRDRSPNDDGRGMADASLSDVEGDAKNEHDIYRDERGRLVNEGGDREGHQHDQTCPDRD